MADEKLNRLTKIHNKINALFPFQRLFSFEERSYHQMRRTRIVYLFVLIFCRQWDTNNNNQQLRENFPAESEKNKFSVHFLFLLVRAPRIKAYQFIRDLVSHAIYSDCVMLCTLDWSWIRTLRAKCGRNVSTIRAPNITLQRYTRRTT